MGKRENSNLAKEESEFYSLSVLQRNCMIMVCCHYKEREHTNRWKGQ